MEHSIQIEKYKKKLVSNARSILTNQIGVPLGAVKMNRIIFWATKSKVFQDIDLKIFEEYTKKFNGCPVGTERLLWNKEALKEQDKHLDKLTAIYKDQIFDKCFEIIKKFEDTRRTT